AGEAELVRVEGDLVRADGFDRVDERGRDPRAARAGGDAHEALEDTSGRHRVERQRRVAGGIENGAGVRAELVEDQRVGVEGKLELHRMSFGRRDADVAMKVR